MKDEDKMAVYMTGGMMGGLFIGTIVSILFSASNFISIAGGAIGLNIGMLLGIIVWGLKKGD